MVVKEEVSEPSAQSIMEGLENTTGIRLNNHRRKLKQRFDIVKKLGQGTYGKVQLGINKETGQEVAIKTIKKAKIETDADLIRIRREIQIMSSVRHPHIIHIYEVFENREKMVLVMEYASGGELYDYLSEKKVLLEEEARRIFRQIACAVYYCHKHKICHRDLKLENILLDEKGNAKIADFGLSNVFDAHHLLTTFCGSPLYASPEIVRGTPYQGPEVDCWSLGVLLYTLVYGAMPFDGSNFKRLVKQISQGDYYEPKKISSASPLIHHMLTVIPGKRANVEDICSHWWVNEGYSESCLEIAEDLANQTPVRLDLLLSLAPQPAGGDQVVVPTSQEMKAPPVLTAETRDMMNEYLTNNADLLLRSQSDGSLMDIDQSATGKSDEKDSTSNKRKLQDSFSGSAALVNKGAEAKKKDRAERTEKNSRTVRKKTCTPFKSKSSPGLEPMEVDEEIQERTVLPSDTLSGVSELVTELAPESQDMIDDMEPVEQRKTSIPSLDEMKEKKKSKISKVKTSPAVEDKPAITTKASESVQEGEGKMPIESQLTEKVETQTAKIAKVPEVREKSPLKEKSPVPNTVAENLIIKDGEETIKRVKKVKKKKKEEKTDVKETEKENVPQMQKPESEVNAETANNGAAEPSGDNNKEEATLDDKLEEKKDKVEKIEERKESPPKTKPSESATKLDRRNSNIAKAAEMFKNLGARAQESKQQGSEKPRKILIPGLKVSDAKKAFENKQPEKKSVTLAGVKVSDAKKAFEQGKKTSKIGSVEKTAESPSPTKAGTSDPMITASKNIDEAENKLESKVINNSQKQVEKTEDREIAKMEEQVKESKLVPALKPSDKAHEEAKVRKLKDVGKLQLEGISASVDESQKFKPVVLNTGSGAPKSVAMLVHGPTSPPVSSPASASSSPQKKAVFFPSSGRFASKSRSNSAVPEGKGNSQVASTPDDVLEQPAYVEAQEPAKEEPSSPPKQPLKISQIKSEELQAEEKFRRTCDGTENSYLKSLASKPKLTRRESSGSNASDGKSMDDIPKAVPDSPRKKTAMEIVLSNSQNRMGSKAATLPRRSSKAEMLVNGLPPTPTQPSPPYKIEVEHRVGETPDKPHTQRTEVSFPVSAPEPTREKGKKERIIPIRVEDRERELSPPVRSVSSIPKQPAETPQPRAKSISRQSTQDSDTESLSSPHLEPIRKSPREYIIPILVEGGGCITPKEDLSEATTTEDGFRTDSRLRRGRFSRSKKFSLLTDAAGNASEDEGSSVNNPYPTYQRNQSVGREDGEEDNQNYKMHKLRSSRASGHQYPLDHSDSFSSAEEDDDDGFEILTAESLFSTLLARVRSLTRRLNRDDPSIMGSRRFSRQSSLHSQNGSTPGTPTSAGPMGTSGFWSPSYGRESSAPWRKTSKDSYDGDSVYSGGGATATASTVQRAGGGSTHSARSEGAESDVSSDTSSSYPAYTPSLSRRLTHRLSTTSLPASRRPTLDDITSTRSDPDGNSRAHLGRMEFGEDAFPRRRDYSRTLSSLEMPFYSSRLNSGDFMGSAYATLRSPLLTSSITASRPYRRSQSVLDSGVEEPSRGWVRGQGFSLGRVTRRAGSEDPTTPTRGALYETSFTSGNYGDSKSKAMDSVVRTLEKCRSGRTSAPILSRNDRAISELRNGGKEDGERGHYGIDAERKMRAASECRFGGPRHSMIGGKIAMFDNHQNSTQTLPTESSRRAARETSPAVTSSGSVFSAESSRRAAREKSPAVTSSGSVFSAESSRRAGRETSPVVTSSGSTLPRLRDLQTQSLKGLRKEEEVTQDMPKTEISRPQQKSEKVAEKAPVEPLPKGTLKMRPDMIIRKKLIPLVEAAKVAAGSSSQEAPVAQNPEPKPSKEIASGVNVVNSILNRFRKFEETAKESSVSKPPIIPRNRRAQSVYSGATSDGVLLNRVDNLAEKGAERETEQKKSSGLAKYRRAATMEFNMNTEDSKKELLTDKMKDILKEKPSDKKGKTQIPSLSAATNDLSRSKTESNVKSKSAEVEDGKLDKKIKTVKKEKEKEKVLKCIKNDDISKSKKEKRITTKEEEFKVPEEPRPVKDDIKLEKKVLPDHKNLDFGTRSGEMAHKRRLKSIEVIYPQHERNNNHLLGRSSSVLLPSESNDKLIDPIDESPKTPTDSLDSASVCSDNFDRSSLLDDEESVSERIRRKSFFSRFNEPIRRKSKQRRPSKEYSDHLMRPRLHLDISNDVGETSRHTAAKSPPYDTLSPLSPTSEMRGSSLYNGNPTSRSNSFRMRPREDREWSLPRYSSGEESIFATMRRDRKSSNPFSRISTLGSGGDISIPENEESIYQNGDIPEEDGTESSTSEATPKQKSYSSRRQSSSRLGALLSQLQTSEDDHNNLVMGKRSSLVEGGLLSREPLGRRTNRYSSYLDPEISGSSLRDTLGGYTSPTYSSSTLPRPTSAFLDRSWRSGSAAEDGTLHFRQ